MSTNDPPRRRPGTFAPGNGGRPKGARSRLSRAAEELLDGESEALTRKAIDLAKAGDVTALRLCLERLLPPRKDRPILFDLPTVETAKDHPAALASILSAVANGELTPTEAQAFASIMAEHRRAIETADIVERLEALEGRAGQ